MQIQEFPLYDQLLEEVKTNPKTVESRRLCATINKMYDYMKPEQAAEHAKLIGALCLHHELISSKGVMFHTIPYSGVSMPGKKGVTLSIAQLPNKLIQIIDLYLEKCAAME